MNNCLIEQPGLTQFLLALLSKCRPQVGTDLERPRQSEEGKNMCANDVCDVFTPSGDKAARLKDRLLEVAGLSEIFKALGDETRTKILYLLSLEELCVCNLAQILDISVPAVSHHLRLLRALRLVKYRREGKTVCYSLDDEHIVNMIRQAQEHFAEDR